MCLCVPTLSLRLHAVILFKITRKTWKAKDSRMKMVNELLQNIRFLKFYGWGDHSLLLSISYVHIDAREFLGNKGARRQGDGNSMGSEKEYR